MDGVFDRFERHFQGRNVIYQNVVAFESTDQRTRQIEFVLHQKYTHVYLIMDGVMSDNDCHCIAWTLQFRNVAAIWSMEKELNASTLTPAAADLPDFAPILD
jgi:hypothetical protein